MQGLSAVFVAGLAIYGLFFSDLPETLARQMIASSNTQIADLQRQRQALAEQRDQLSMRIGENGRTLTEQGLALATSSARLEQSRSEERSARAQARGLSDSLHGAQQELSDLHAASRVLEKDTAEELCSEAAITTERLWLDGPVGREITYLRLAQFDDTLSEAKREPQERLREAYERWGQQHPFHLLDGGNWLAAIDAKDPDSAGAMLLYSSGTAEALAQAYKDIVADETNSEEGGYYSHALAALDRQQRRAVTPAMRTLVSRLRELLVDRKEGLSGPLRLPPAGPSAARSTWPALIPSILRRVVAADEYHEAVSEACKPYTG